MMLGYQKFQDSLLTKMRKKYDILLQEKEESKNRAIGDLTKFYETKLQQQAKELNKEKMNCVLIKRNQDLVKSNFELEFKLKELQNLIKSRDNTINRMICKIKQMESEFEICNKLNTDLETSVKELTRKLTAKDKELQEERQKVCDAEAVVKQFQIDLHDSVGYIQDQEMLKESIKIESAKMKADIQKDFRRQRELLESSVAALRKKLVEDSEFHRADKIRILEENSSLLQEINDLRRELQKARSQIYNLEVSMRTPRKKSQADPKPFITSPGSVTDEQPKEKERIKDYIKINGSVPVVNLEFEPNDNKKNTKTSERNTLPSSDLKFESPLPICLPSLQQTARKLPTTSPRTVKNKQSEDKEKLKEIIKINSLPTSNLNRKSQSYRRLTKQAASKNLMFRKD